MHFEHKLKSLIKKRYRIGVGIAHVDDDVLQFLSSASSFVDLVIFGSKIENFESVISEDPEGEIVSYLKDNKIDGIVRGQLDAVKLRGAMSSIFGYSSNDFSDIAFVEDIQGRFFVLCPISNQQGWSKDHKIKLISESIKIFKILNIPIKIGVLAGVRPGSLGKISFLDETYKDAEEIVNYFKNNYPIKNYNIEFEKAMSDQCSIIVEINGMVGNQVLRSLVFSGGLKIFGAPVCGIKETVIDTFRNSNDFTLYVLLCAAMLNIK